MKYFIITLATDLNSPEIPMFMAPGQNKHDPKQQGKEQSVGERQQ